MGLSFIYVVGVLALCGGLQGDASASAEVSEARAAAAQSTSNVCNSLSGPFCHHLGLDSAFASYMTPISPLDVTGKSSKSNPIDEALVPPAKTCFFRHYSRSWMDAGGDENDIMSQQVKTSDECERLCCEHPKCKSYTFWMGHTCFLRAKKNRPREEGNSFSANKLQ